MKKFALFIALICVLSMLFASCKTETERSSSLPDTSESSVSEVSEISEPKPVSRNIFYDPYFVYPQTAEYLGEKLSLYRKTVENVINHVDTTEGFSSEEEAFDIWSTVLSVFNPSQVLIATYKNDEEPYSYEDGKLTVKFLHEKEEHDDIFKKYEFTVNGALKLLDKNTDKDAYDDVKILFDHVSAYMSYGYATSVYDSVVSGIGICGDYADYLSLLCSYAGIPACTAYSTGDGMDHGWSVICIDGQWYHFDACWQHSFSQYEYFEPVYFAMSEEYRIETLEKTGAKVTISPGFVGYPYSVKFELPVCDDTRYDDICRENAERFNRIIAGGEEDYEKSQGGQSVYVSEFSYTEESAIYTEGNSGVKTSGFVNDLDKRILINSDNIMLIAENECTIGYDTSKIYYDSKTDIWKVVFFAKGTPGGEQAVYMNANGRTVLIVYGE